MADPKEKKNESEKGWWSSITGAFKEAHDRRARQEAPIEIYDPDPEPPYVRSRQQDDPGYYPPTEIDVDRPASPTQRKSSQNNSAAVVIPTSAFKEVAQNRADRLIYSVPQRVDAIFRIITKGDPVSYPVMVNLLGSESGFKNVKSETGATGIGQFTGDSFMERLYKSRTLMPSKYDAIISKIERHDIAKEAEHAKAIKEHRKENYVSPVYDYRIAGKTQAERTKNYENVMNLKSDILVSSIAAREHIRDTLTDARQRFEAGIEGKIKHIESTYSPLPQERLKRLREELERPWTVADAKIVYVCGARGGAKLLLAVADIATKDHRILDYTDPHVVRNNQRLFAEDNKNLNPQQFMDSIRQKVGDIVMPDNLSRPTNSHIGQLAALQTIRP